MQRHVRGRAVQGEGAPTGDHHGAVQLAGGRAHVEGAVARGAERAERGDEVGGAGAGAARPGEQEEGEEEERGAPPCPSASTTTTLAPRGARHAHSYYVSTPRLRFGPAGWLEAHPYKTSEGIPTQTTLGEDILLLF